MEKLTQLEESIYNKGERLIPGVTHDIMQLILHRSSYMFFRKVIEKDFELSNKAWNSINILDLGCGVGHGCYTLAALEKSNVVGTDNSNESLEYAKCNYARNNIKYQLAKLEEFIPIMPEYDYVTSRGVFEHIANGLQLAQSTKWKYRLLFDVPYDEPYGRNKHHVLYGIREEDFSEFPNAELFYQDLSGVIYDIRTKPSFPNMIICICSHPSLYKVSELIKFPIPAWSPGLLFDLRKRTRTYMGDIKKFAQSYIRIARNFMK